MPDIFGREPEQYTLVRALQESQQWDRYQRANAERRPTSLPQHNFGALGQGVPLELTRATEDAQAVGYVTNNLLAIQTMIDEIMYTAYRLPEYVHINTSISEGASSYGVRVLDRRGQSERVSAPGYDAPSATVSQSLVTREMFYYGLDAEWSIDELRGAMMAGIPLDTQSIEAAVTGSMEKLEAVALYGGGYAGVTGLINHTTSGDGMVNVSTAGQTFAGGTAEQIRTEITNEISKVIEGSRETLGRNINTGMTVYLPGTQYDLLTSRYLGDNAERTVMRGLMEDNPWTHFTNGSPLSIARVLELDSALNPGSTVDRMITALKHERVAEMGVSIMPRVLRIIDQGRVITAQVESKFSNLFVKRPNTIYYRNNI